MGTNMRHYATAGVRVFLNIIVLRRDRAKAAITMAVGICTPAEHASVIIPPHLTDGSLSIGTWGTVAPTPNQSVRPDKNVARYRQLAAQRKQSQPTDTVTMEQQQAASETKRVKPTCPTVKEQQEHLRHREHVWQTQHPGVIVVDTARANSTTNDDAGGGTRGEGTMMGNELHDPDTGVVTVLDSMCYSTISPGRRPRPGERTHPVTLYDSDETILGNSDTESNNDNMMPEAVIWAANLVSEFRREQCADIDSIRELRAELVELANTIDAGRALQQVTVRFRSESNMSWEARGAALMGEQPDYGTSVKLRLQNPHQDDVNWERYARIYVQMLALLQLVADDLHAIWPMTHGGEARFRRLHAT